MPNKIPSLSSPSYYPFSTLTKPLNYPGVFLLELHARPDNRLTESFLQSSLIAPLLDVEREFRASLLGRLEASSEPSQGWKAPLQPGQYALVTCGPQDKNRFYSNGLDLTQALASDHFFQHVLNRMYETFLRFPIPTVAAINGHAFAAGFCLALAHDHKIIKDNEGKGKALMAMNEVEFGAPVPLGLLAVIKAKFPTDSAIRKCVTEAHRFGVKDVLSLGLVDAAAPENQVVEASLKLAFDKSIKATTGVYGEIKESLYKKYIDELNCDDGRHQEINSIHMSRLKRLGLTPYGKSKL
ncbi:hypothetical protein O181_076135 [Austropuccinia psidii MF-1]|uniref:Enoyl-CoA hydratase n=1 Tax=Austropuccinia psidii MF-1 TaxID=1389203 RepID=A0A9Q3FFN2_9BASI|nr:hypothetical protein [Austropuccinia psidii MF-1]